MYAYLAIVFVYNLCGAGAKADVWSNGLIFPPVVVEVIVNDSIKTCKQICNIN